MCLLSLLYPSTILCGISFYIRYLFFFEVQTTWWVFSGIMGCFVGTRTSAGLRSSPGSRNLSSRTGPSPAATAVLKKASLRLLCRLILSPPVPQHKAWSPMMSLGRRQAGQCPSALSVKHWQAKAVFHHKNNFSCPQMEAESSQ